MIFISSSFNIRVGGLFPGSWDLKGIRKCGQEILGAGAPGSHSVMQDVSAGLMAIIGGDLETRASASVSEAPPKAGLKKVLSFKGFGKRADTGARAANPESVIPLDDKDFKNF
jgi:hypothetical protein